MESVGAGAFAGTGIEAFKVDPANRHFSVTDGILYSADKRLLIAFPAKCTITELSLPSECIGISGAAFDRTGIRKVTLGSKFRAIDGFAFCQSKLSEINMPESLVFIGEQAFAGTNLSSVSLPGALPEIQNAVFAECKALSSVTIPASVKYIDIRAFYNCTSLATVNCEGMTPPELKIGTRPMNHRSTRFLLPLYATFPSERPPLTREVRGRACSLRSMNRCPQR